MATYQELTQLRPSVIAGLTRNHNIHLDPDPAIITTREAIRILAGGAVLAANLTVNCQSFAADDIATPVPVTTPALVPLSPFAGETIIEGDFRFRHCLLNVNGQVDSFRDGGALANLDLQLGGTTGTGTVYPTFELSDCTMIWTPGAALVDIPGLEDTVLTDHLIGGTSARGGRDYIFDNSYIFADGRIGEDPNPSTGVFPRRPGLQFANAISLSILGATFDGWWMNVGVSLAIGNAVLTLATRNATGTSQRYRLRVTDNPVLTNSYGLLVQSDISNFLADPLVDFSRGINIRQTRNDMTVANNQYIILNCIFPAPGITVNAQGIAAGSVEMTSAAGWNPRFIDVNTESTVSDIRYHFENNVDDALEMPTSYVAQDGLKPTPFTQDSLKPSNGFLLQSSSVTPTGDGENDFVTLRGQGLRDFECVPKSYTHNIPVTPIFTTTNSIALDPSTNDINFELNDIQPTLLEEDLRAIDEDSITTGVSQTEALTADRVTLDDVYRGIKSTWYDTVGTEDADGFNRFQTSYRQFNPLSSDGVYVINGDYRYSIGNNDVTLTDTRTTIGQTTPSSVTQTDSIRVIKPEVNATPAIRDRFITFRMSSPGEDNWPPGNDQRGYMKFYTGTLSDLIAAQTLVSGGSPTWQTRNAVALGTLAISTHDVEGNRIADFLDSLTLDDTNPHVFSTILSNGITLSIGLVSTVDASSAAYNDSRVIFDDVRFFEVAVNLTGTFPITNNELITFDFQTGAARVDGSAGNFVQQNFVPILHGVDCGTGTGQGIINWGTSEYPPADSDGVRLLADADGEVFRGQMFPGDAGTDNRWQIRNSNVDGLEVDNLAPSVTTVLIEFLNCTGTPILGTGVEEFIAPENTVIEFAASEPAGRYYISDPNSSTPFAEAAKVADTVVQIPIPNISDNEGDFIIYYKPFNSGTIAYYTTIETVTITANAPATTVAIPAIEIPEVLSEAALSVTTTALAELSDSMGLGVIDIHGADGILGADETLRIFLDAISVSAESYIRIQGENRLTVEPIEPAIQSSTLLTNDHIILESTAATVTEQRQQLVRGLLATGTGTTSRDLPFTIGVFAVVPLPNPAGATPGEIAAEFRSELDARRVTRPNMNALGVLAPIDDTDPS